MFFSKRLVGFVNQHAPDKYLDKFVQNALELRCDEFISFSALSAQKSARGKSGTINLLKTPFGLYNQLVVLEKNTKFYVHILAAQSIEKKEEKRDASCICAQ